MPRPERSGPAALRSRRTEFTTRSAEDGTGLTIEGYFIVYDQPYIIDAYLEEVICPGAIDERTDTSDVRALVDHVPHLVLGRTTANTLSLDFGDDYGVHGSIALNDQDTDAVNLYARAQRGDVDQASFGFDEDEVAYIDLPDGRTRREVRHISKLWEVSVCTFPAYEQTYVAARSRLSDDAQQHRTEAAKKRLKRRLKHHA